MEIQLKGQDTWHPQDPNSGYIIPYINKPTVDAVTDRQQDKNICSAAHSDWENMWICKTQCTFIRAIIHVSLMEDVIVAKPKQNNPFAQLWFQFASELICNQK